MSQRLFIGQPEHPSYYDCVITSDTPEADYSKKLAEDWLCLTPPNPFFLGPWKIGISDFDLYRQVEPALENLFQILRTNYPEAIWMFYDESKALIEHPTRAELDEWLSQHGQREITQQKPV